MCNITHLHNIMLGNVNNNNVVLLLFINNRISCNDIHYLYISMYLLCKYIYLHIIHNNYTRACVITCRQCFHVRNLKNYVWKFKGHHPGLDLLKDPLNFHT